MKYKLFIIWLSFKWIFRINLGDYVWYVGKKYQVANGVRSLSWRLYDLKNDDKGWVLRSKCRKSLTLRNLYQSFKSGLWFYRTNWLEIWQREGIKPWMKDCNIW